MYFVVLVQLEGVSVEALSDLFEQQDKQWLAVVGKYI